MIPGNAAFADKDKHGKDRGEDHGNGHWRDRDRHRDHDDDDDRRGYGFAEHDRDEFRGWYAENYRNLPPGLESRVVFGPVDLDRRLPPPPPDCERGAIGGHIVLRNRNTKIIVDIFHFE